jgi:hypothetical protein
VIQMTKDELVAKLRNAGFEIRSQVRVQSHDRWRLLLANGAIVDCLDNGFWSLWGHDQDALRAALGPMDEVPAPPVDAPIVVERARAIADAAADRIRVELQGRAEPGAPPFTNAFLIGEPLARELALDLSTAAYRTRMCRESERLGRAVAPRARRFG